ncbi:type II toxin-antitoxin system HicB family antitoxin [Pasteurellaceae bacterium 20609_3]|uniref:type II toxin-antitoxin system HicB family antitoxin n=1 Tax=Spirabiliibacterium mucosae TaxID=28156 RepID=UPI001AADBF10|nr:type II toxin-antitoxin system HicB family antitoxin [Spirabiliibacterium mucosae]MBE2897481.1 type II toxin-antitoxin system HicB family antitoxin [Spirabiliibacterium mucosae]
MLMTIGIETPQNDHEAYGIAVPVLFTERYACLSAADTLEEIPTQALDAIHSILEMMVECGEDITALKDKGYRYYQSQEEFNHCDTWLLLDVDLSAYQGKRQRINISLPEYLIQRIDSRVASNPVYKDRSHFIAVATQKELHL